MPRPTPNRSCSLSKALPRRRRRGENKRQNEWAWGRVHRSSSERYRPSSVAPRLAAPATTEKAAGTDAPKGTETATNTDSKAAAADDVMVPEFTPEFHAKIGSAMLQFAEGRDMVERCLRQLHGAEMATDIIKAAAFMEEHALALQQAELEGATAAEQLAENLKVASTLAEDSV